MFKTIFSTKGTQKKFQKEVEHIFILGALEISNNLEWGTPYFT